MANYKVLILFGVIVLAGVGVGILVGVGLNNYVPPDQDPPEAPTNVRFEDVAYMDTLSNAIIGDWNNLVVLTNRELSQQLTILEIRIAKLESEADK